MRGVKEDKKERGEALGITVSCSGLLSSLPSLASTALSASTKESSSRLPSALENVREIATASEMALRGASG